MPSGKKRRKQLVPTCSRLSTALDTDKKQPISSGQFCLWRSALGTFDVTFSTNPLATLWFLAESGESSRSLITSGGEATHVEVTTLSMIPCFLCWLGDFVLVSLYVYPACCLCRSRQELKLKCLSHPYTPCERAFFWGWCGWLEVKVVDVLLGGGHQLKVLTGNAKRHMGWVWCYAVHGASAVKISQFENYFEGHVWVRAWPL